METLKAREYLRVSFDRSGFQKSNDQQQNDNRRVWDRESWEWGDHFSDATSASRYASKPRDDWENLINELKDEQLGADVLVFWESSRGSRQVGEWVELLDLCAEAGVLVAVTEHRRIYDPRVPRDRRTLLEDAVDSEYESAKSSARIRRDAAASAAAGRPHGPPPPGYRRLYHERTGQLLTQEPDPATAPFIRELFRLYAAGHARGALADAANKVGVLFIMSGHEPVTWNKGKPWWVPTLGKALRNPQYKGVRVHNGVEHKAVWEPLVDETLWETVQARFAARRKHKGRAVVGASLLTSVLRCGICRGRVKRTANNGIDSYSCRGLKDHVNGKSGCTGRAVAKLEPWVTALILERLAQTDIADALEGAPNPEVEAARARAAELQAELDEAEALWKQKKLTIARLAMVESELAPQIAAAEREARASVIPLHLDLPEDRHLEALAQWWGALGLGRQREVVAALIETITLQRAGSRWAKVSDTVTVEWRR